MDAISKQRYVCYHREYPVTILYDQIFRQCVFSKERTYALNIYSYAIYMTMLISTRDKNGNLF